MKKKEFIIIHGLNGSPKGHWQDFLYEDLKELGENVFFPQFSNNGNPNLNLWLEQLHKLEKHINENTVVIAHSMGVILWLNYLNKYKKTRILNTILVAPPSNDFLKSNKTTNSFSNFILDKDLFHDSTNKSLLIASTNDEYCTETAKKAFSDILNINYLELLADSGHINIDSGFGRWDDILKIALDN